MTALVSWTPRYIIRDNKLPLRVFNLRNGSNLLIYLHGEDLRRFVANALNLGDDNARRTGKDGAERMAKW
jgi:hypothetical protein